VVRVLVPEISLLTREIRCEDERQMELIQCHLHLWALVSELSTLRGRLLGKLKLSLCVTN
jgi:hypothetical protein